MSRKDRIMCDEIGEFFEEPGEIRCEWRISDFTSGCAPSKEIDKWFCSPKFIFSNACWCLKIYLLGTLGKLYMCRNDSGPPKTLEFQFGFRRQADSRAETFSWVKIQFDTISREYGAERSLNMKNDGSTSNVDLLDVFTITCTLKSVTPQNVESSLFSRLWNLSLRVKNILTAREKTDVVLKLNDGELSAHRMILESESDVFNRMFNIDMSETHTGRLNVEDGKKGTFEVVLSYVYSGDPEGLCADNMCEVYKAAHKYHLQELMKLCVGYMQNYLSNDTICDIMVLARLYQETTLKECAKDYLTKSKTGVFKSAKWEKIKQENLALSVEVMEYVFGE